MKYILLLLLISFQAYAEVVDISFEPPTAREDGTLLSPSEIAGYGVFNDGVAISPTSLVFGVNTVAVDLPYGRHNLTMTTVDTNGRESLYSVVFSFVLNANPKPPKIHGVTKR